MFQNPCNISISSAFAAVTKLEVLIIYQGVYAGLRAGPAHMSWEFWAKAMYRNS